MRRLYEPYEYACMKKILIFLVFLVFIVVVAYVADAFKPTQPLTLTKVTVQLGWLVNANQAGFFVAQKKGFYAEEGLDVTNKPGGPDFPSIVLVTSGAADFGVESGAESILLARQNDIPIKAVAILDRKSPYVFFSKKSSGISSPKDFEGKTVAVSYGRPLEVVYRALVRKERLATSTITEVKKNPAIASLFSGAVDVQPGFISDFIFAKAAGKKDGIEINALYPFEYGIDSYGYTIFTTDRFIEEHPDTVQKYIRATLRGWKYAFDYPEEAVDMVAAEMQGTVDKEAELEALKTRAAYVLPNTDGETLGWMDEAKWQTMQDTLLEQGLMAKPLNLQDVYTNQFLKI